MAESENRFAKVTWQIMEQLLEVDSIDEALSGSLEIIVNTLKSEAGAIWILDPKTDRISPLFTKGEIDFSGISVENGVGIEGVVTKSGKSMIISDTMNLKSPTTTPIDIENVEKLKKISGVEPSDLSEGIIKHSESLLNKRYIEIV